MDTRDFSVDTIQEIYDIIEELKGQGTIGDSIHDFLFIGEPDAGMLCTYASRDEMTEYYEKYADGMDLTKKKFDKIVENVREVDSKYQEEFLKSKEELKNFGETLKNMTEEISLRTVSLDTSHYNLAIGVIEGEDSEKKEKLKEIIGITPGTTKESELLQKIREILKYSTGNGEFDDEIDVESEEATLVQKKKLIAQVESLKEQFRNGELTQDELLDKLCEIYHVEDYGSQINYSLAFKKYMPEKKARIVSDILSTAMYIMEEDGLDAEKIEEIARSVKAKSYIEDEMWTMAENAFRGAVVGANAAIAGKYYTGQAGDVESGSSSMIDIDAIRPKLKTEPDTAFFWSGRTDGIGGAENAANIAKSRGGVTLESTIENQNIVMPEWDFNNPSTMEAWDLASGAYAEQVSGEIRAVIGSELRAGNIWENVELPRLKNNPNVTKIITIDPKTGIENVIFER